MSDTRITRREFIVTGLGYAAAVSPITAWAVSTPQEGLTAGDTEIPVGKEKMPAYLAMPNAKGPFPCVIVIQEIFGIHEYIKDVCRRFAKEGYLAVAPSLYFRQGDATKITEIPKILSDIVSKVKQAQVMTDLDAVEVWLVKNAQADVRRLGVTGFCWGGNATWMYCNHNPRVKAGVAWYGRVTGDKSETNPKYPVEIAPELKVPVLGLYGEKDNGIPLESLDKMKEALKKGKSHSEIVVFPGAEHGFHADYRPSYNERAAKEGWQKALAWFKKNGVL